MDISISLDQQINDALNTLLQTVQNSFIQTVQQATQQMQALQDTIQNIPDSRPLITRKQIKELLGRGMSQAQYDRSKRNLLVGKIIVLSNFSEKSDFTLAFLEVYSSWSAMRKDLNGEWTPIKILDLNTLKVYDLEP